MPGQYDVIIIGAGIGGLTAGNILAKNGMKVLILEKNHAPGGGVSTYYRNGYPIDISHALCAVNRDACLRNMFEYLGIYNKLEFLKLDKTFILIKEKQEKPIFCYSDLNKYMEELQSYFPNEIYNIKRLFKEIILTWENEILKSYYNPPLMLRLLYPILYPRLFKYRNDTFEQFLNRFNLSSGPKEVLSTGWPYLGMEKEHLSALYMICMLGAYHKDGSYFIKGGFGKLVEALTSNFKDFRGEIILNTEVERILLNNKKVACGVKDKKGNVYHGKIIVSNADSKKTFLELLDKNCLPNKFLKMINKSVMTRPAMQIHVFAEAEIDPKFLSCGSIILTFNIDLEKKLRAMLKFTETPYEKPVLILSLNPLEYFTPGVPKNNFVFNVCWYPANYRLWKDFLDKFGKQEYENMKREAGETIAAELKKVWAVKDIKFVNVLTPLSMEKWLGSTEGAIYDLAITPQQALLNRLKHKTPTKNLYLVGTKTFPGSGMAGGLFSAFALADIILKGELTKRKTIL